MYIIIYVSEAVLRHVDSKPSFASKKNMSIRSSFSKAGAQHDAGSAGLHLDGGGDGIVYGQI